MLRPGGAIRFRLEEHGRNGRVLAAVMAADEPGAEPGFVMGRPMAVVSRLRGGCRRDVRPLAPSCADEGGAGCRDEQQHQPEHEETANVHSPSTIPRVTFGTSSCIPGGLLMRSGVKSSCLTPMAAPLNPRFVRVMRPVTFVLVLLAMVAPQAGVFCEGWQTSAQARMACCAEGANCGMHESPGSSDTTGSRAQDAADQCCAASESNDSQTPRSTVSIHSPAIVVRVPAALTPPETSGTPVWYAYSAFSPPRHVSTHVLLSVFLV